MLNQHSLDREIARPPLKTLTVPRAEPPQPQSLWAARVLLSKTDTAGLALGLAICSVPLSIAVTECFLAIALLLRIFTPSRPAIYAPKIFWAWSLWAGLEILSWLRSPDIKAGLGEIRHLLLPLAVYLVMPALSGVRNRVKIWHGLFVTATVGSCFVIGGFISRLQEHWTQIATAPDPSMYLRTGGLLHHWMIYGTVEIVVFAGLLEFWRLYPEHRRRLTPVVAINALAISLSLTRMLWVCCLLLLVLHLVRRRSLWVWATPVLPLFLLVIPPVRTRVIESLDPGYYSNAERLQMLHVGWKMILQHPILGVGAGRIEKLYPAYISSGEPLPAYHGHLHNNVTQLAAQFGLPVAMAAVTCLALIFIEIRRRARSSGDRDKQFLCCASGWGLAAFLMAGMFEYTYGHSLALILMSFLVLVPFPPDLRTAARQDIIRFADRVLATLLLMEFLPVIIICAGIVWVLSRRSPFVAHLRAGQNGRLFWMWKLRTMWPLDGRPSPVELGFVQRIDADPLYAIKPERDPRVTSRFAAFCRRHSLDELPQLLHVVRGEMSLVGPRPLTRGELARHYSGAASEILTIPPGLTGYWQISGRSRLSYAERVKLDLGLVRDLSARVYFVILLKTIPQVLGGNNAW